jgi:uncharacterized phage-like protein YoqJ
MIFAGSGHRTYKVGNFHPLLWPDVEHKLYRLATAYLDLMCLKRPTKLISGMATGWDTAWALAALDLDIPVIAAVAFEGVEKKWSTRQQKIFHDVCARSTVIYISEPAKNRQDAGKKFQIRNEWMVDRCDRLVTLWDGSNSGTANCVKYANTKGIQVDHLWKYWLNMPQIEQALDGNYI